MVVLDTDILIGFLRDDREAVGKITKLIEQHVILYTTSINTAELYFGAFLSENTETNLKVVEKLIKTLNVIPFELTHSKFYGEIRANLQKKGELINELDIFIAAIAVEKDIPIITRNAKHFKRILKLQVESW